MLERQLSAPTGCAASGDWVNGNLNENNSHYREGDSVPFRTKLTNLTPGTSYSFTIGYDTIQGGKHAYDYLTSYNRTESSANPCAGLLTVRRGAAGDPGRPVVVFTNPGSSQAAGQFSIWNGNVTGVAYGLRSAGGSRAVVISFTATASTVVVA